MFDLFFVLFVFFLLAYAAKKLAFFVLNFFKNKSSQSLVVKTEFYEEPKLTLDSLDSVSKVNEETITTKKVIVKKPAKAIVEFKKNQQFLQERNALVKKQLQELNALEEKFSGIRKSTKKTKKATPAVQQQVAKTTAKVVSVPKKAVTSTKAVVKQEEPVNQVQNLIPDMI